MAFPIIETARLLLRPCTQDDLEALYHLWIDPDVRRYLWDNVIISKERAASFLQDSIACFERHGFGQWAVYDKGKDVLIGFCGFRFLDGTPEIEILYGMAPAYWGQGLTTEAAGAVLRYGFDVLAFTRVVADADPPNVASFRVMEKLGMRYESRKRRHNVEVIAYVITREAFPHTGRISVLNQAEQHVTYQLTPAAPMPLSPPTATAPQDQRNTP